MYNIWCLGSHGSWNTLSWMYVFIISSSSYGVYYDSRAILMGENQCLDRNIGIYVMTQYSVMIAFMLQFLVEFMLRTIPTLCMLILSYIFLVLSFISFVVMISLTEHSNECIGTHIVIPFTLGIILLLWAINIIGRHKLRNKILSDWD